MENKIEIIDQRELLNKQFKMYGTIENPLFLAKDVAKWIDHSNTRMMLSNVDKEEKQCVNNPYASSGQQEQWFLTEDGLYEVLMQSRKPIAKQFKKEVKSILRQIRKTGGYISVDKEDTNEEILSKAFIIAQNTINSKDKFIKELIPKAEAYDDFLGSKGFVSLNKAAHGLKLGRNKMCAFLREQGVLFNDNHSPLPHTRFEKSGYFTVDHGVGRNGHIYSITKVSSRGIDYIHKLYQRNNSLEEQNV